MERGAKIRFSICQRRSIFPFVFPSIQRAFM